MFLDTGMELAGGQHSLLTLLKLLDRARYFPLVYAPARSRLQGACERMGLETHVLPFRSVHFVSHARPGIITWPEDFVRMLAGFFFLAVEMRRKRVDVVHANTFKAALVASLACLFAGKPLVFHDRIVARHGILSWMVARRAGRIIAVSSSVARTHGEALRGKVSLIYDGIDTEYMSPDKVPARTGEHKERVVGFLGRISREKGVDLLVEAARLVVTRVPDAVFLVGGSPYTPADVSYRRDLEALVENARLSSKFLFAGYIEDSRDFLMKADVVVVPSRQESLGCVLLEAMSLKRPVVAFDIDGPKEIITDHKEGLLVEPGNVEDLAQAIVTFLRDRALAEAAGDLGRQTVISRFSAKTFVSRISEIYDEIADSSGPAQRSAEG
jgi:glycosyltransferase involved in cell wall biosynthesis